MIEIPRAGLVEPEGFDQGCRQKGAAWLKKNPKSSRSPGQRPRDYWSAFKPQLAVAFGERCAYGAMYEPVGTVDHFLPVDVDESLAYEWHNFRFAQALASGQRFTVAGLAGRYAPILRTYLKPPRQTPGRRA